MYKHLNAEQRDVLIQILLLANFSENEWEWEGKIYKCEPGQFVTSLASIKEVCAKNVTTQNIRTALLALERWQFLTNKSTKTGRLITVLNWDTYQHPTNKDTNKELTKHQQRANKELTTNNNGNNVKNVNNDNKESTLTHRDILKTNELRDELQQQFPGVNIKLELDKMFDWLTANGKVYKDYKAFARNWLRRAEKDKKPEPVYQDRQLPRFEKCGRCNEYHPPGACVKSSAYAANLFNK